MALNFPSSPNANATYTFNDKSWTYNGNAWALTSATLSTNVVVEVSNLYFTNARVYSNVVTLGYATNSNVALKANVTDLTTANVTEVTDLYFTNARVYSNVTQLGYITTSALSGYATNTQLASYATNAQLASYATNAQLASYATNAQLTSYATTSNLALKANIVDLNTSNITEGSNLYFTNARARTTISVTGSGSYDNSTGIITITQSSNYGDSNVVLLGYATNANVALKANIADLKTANVAELTNLYFTNARTYSNVTQIGYITNSSLTGYATNAQLSSYSSTESGIVINKMTISANASIEAGYSGMSVGPITVSANTTVTVASGSRWIVF